MLCPFLSWKILCCETNGLGAPRNSVLCVWSKSNVVPLHTRKKIEIMWNLCPILISHDVILDFKESGRLFGDSSLATWRVSIIFDPLVFLYTFVLWSIYEVEIHCIISYFIFPIDICLLGEVGNGYLKSIFLIKQRNYNHYHGLFNQLLDVPIDIFHTLSELFSRKVTRHFCLWSK